MNILMLYDNNLSFQDIHEKAIAGTQTAFCDLSIAFHTLGCKVVVLTNTQRSYVAKDYVWDNFKYKFESIHFDLLIVNVSPRLLFDFSFIKAKQKVLWIHNEAKYLLYYSRLKYLIRYLPKIIFSGEYHKSTLPFFIPTGGRQVIPYGLNEEIFKSTFTESRQLKVYFTSNPLRSLRWLIDLWEKQIYPKVPAAELHIFSGWQTYGKWGEQVKIRMQTEIDYARSKSDYNIVVREVLPKKDLFRELKSGRAMLYKGDRAETFCLAVAEAQALGLPTVVCDLGSMKERVLNSKTGYVAKNDNEFVNCALKVLTDDELWLSMHQNAIEQGKQLTWNKSAQAFMALVQQQ